MMNSHDVIRQLTNTGWTLDRVRGAHHVFAHATRPGHVVIPRPKLDPGRGLIEAICKQAGLD
jgi:predicted RNA binding protein YcfA (HicA-like mRNA interferase family)